ncbi:unnamed protein product [Lactuca virosa]|uniref:Uncharacterized protein n=1 Tax=Lactuca virosa TaxID=75947 RepID=A0AAU9M0G6_9ASTR|nr:unnamed protein product [Lactuca virosa]
MAATTTRWWRRFPMVPTQVTTKAAGGGYTRYNVRQWAHLRAAATTAAGKEVREEHEWRPPRRHAFDLRRCSCTFNSGGYQQQSVVLGGWKSTWWKVAVAGEGAVGRWRR